MGDDIGVNVLAENEAEGETTRTGIRVVIRDHGHARGVGKTGDDRRGLAGYVRRAGKGSGSGRRRERSGEQDALGVRGTKTGVQAEKSVEDFYEVVAEGNDLLV